MMINEKYKLRQKLGEGSTSDVFVGKCQESGKKFAIKRRRKEFRSEKEVEELNEIQALKGLDHSSIIKLKKYILDEKTLYLVFPLKETSLAQLIENSDKSFKESDIQAVLVAVAEALKYIHGKSIFHRNIRPANILCDDKVDFIQISDFCLSTSTKQKQHDPFFSSDRHYQAPELLLSSREYSWQVDIWSLGCVIAEMNSLKPLFTGTTNKQQLLIICSILGVPHKKEWSEGYKLADHAEFTWPELSNHRGKIMYKLEDGSSQKSSTLKDSIPTISKSCLKFLDEIFLWNPEKRPSASEVLKNEYVKDVHHRNSDNNSNHKNHENKNGRAGILEKQRIVKESYHARRRSSSSSGISSQQSSDDSHHNRSNHNKKNHKHDENDSGKTIELPCQIDVHYGKSMSRKAERPPDLIMRLKFAGPNYGTFEINVEGDQMINKGRDQAQRIEDKGHGRRHTRHNQMQTDENKKRGKNTQTDRKMSSTSTATQTIRVKGRSQKIQTDPKTGEPVYDLIFVVDESGSVTVEGFELAKRFLILFTNLFGVRPGYTRTALISFSCVTKVEWDFKSFQNQTTLDVANRISEMQYSYLLGTDITSGLNEAKRIIDKSPRQNVIPAVILMTDGGHNASAILPRIPAQQLRDSGADIFILAIDYMGLDMNELQEIAGHNASQRIYQTQFQDLNTIANSVKVFLLAHTL